MLEDKVHETSWNIRKHHLNQLSYSVVPTVVPVKTPRFPTGKSTSKIIQVCPASKGFAKHTQHAHFFPQNARCVVWSKQLHLVLALHLEHQSGDKRSKNSWRQTLKLRVPVSANALQQLRLATYFGLSAEHLSAPHLRCLVWSLIKHAAGRPKWCQAKINIQYNSNWSLPNWFQQALLKPDQTIYIYITLYNYIHTYSESTSTSLNNWDYKILRTCSLGSCPRCLQVTSKSSANCTEYRRDIRHCPRPHRAICIFQEKALLCQNLPAVRSATSLRKR